MTTQLGARPSAGFYVLIADFVVQCLGASACRTWVTYAPTWCCTEPNTICYAPTARAGLRVAPPTPEATGARSGYVLDTHPLP